MSRRPRASKSWPDADGKDPDCARRPRVRTSPPGSRPTATTQWRCARPAAFWPGWGLHRTYDRGKLGIPPRDRNEVAVGPSLEHIDRYRRRGSTPAGRCCARRDVACATRAPAGHRRGRSRRIRARRRCPRRRAPGGHALRRLGLEGASMEHAAHAIDALSVATAALASGTLASMRWSSSRGSPPPPRRHVSSRGHGVSRPRRYDDARTGRLARPYRGRRGREGSVPRLVVLGRRPARRAAWGAPSRSGRDRGPRARVARRGSAVAVDAPDPYDAANAPGGTSGVPSTRARCSTLPRCSGWRVMRSSRSSWKTTRGTRSALGAFVASRASRCSGRSGTAIGSLGSPAVAPRGSRTRTPSNGGQEGGGRTDLENLLLRCSFQHRLVHERG